MADKTSKKRVAILVVGAFGALIVLVVAAFLLLQTGPVRKLITSKLGSMLSTEPDHKVVLEDLEGIVPFRMRLGRAVASDAQGVWLTGENIVLAWSPLALLSGKLLIVQLSASSIKIDRLPAPAAKEAPSEWKPLVLPERLPRVVVERLDIDDLALGESVLGKGGAFRLEGGAVKPESGEGLAASLHLWRTDKGPETKLDLTAKLTEKPPELLIEGKFHEAPEGWLAAVLGLKDAGDLELALNGKGPPSKWKGTLNGNMGKYGSLKTDIQLAAQQEISLELHGETEAAPSLWSPRFAPLLSGKNRFGIALHFVPDRSMALERMDLQGTSYEVKAAGKVDLKSQEVQGELSLGMRDLKVLERLAERPIAGTLDIRGSVSGTLRQPQGNLMLDLHGMQVESVQIARMRTEFEFTPYDPKAASFSGLRISGTGSADQIEVLDKSKSPETHLTWAVDLSVPTKGAVLIRQFQIEGDQHFLNVAGEFDPTELDGKVDSKLEVKDLRLLTAFLGDEHPGALKIEVHIKGEGGNGLASAHIDGELLRVGGLPPALMALLGTKVTLVGDLELKKEERINVSAFRLEGQGFRLTSEASFQFADSEVKGIWNLSLPKLESVGKALNKPLTGSLEAEGNIKGALKTLDLEVSLRGRDIVWEKAKFERVLSDLHASGVPQTPTGALSLEMMQGKERLTASTKFSLNDRELKLSSVSMEAPGSKLNGDLAVMLDKTLVQGNVDGQFKDLADLGRFLGESMAGSGEVAVRLSHDKGGQDVKASVKGRGLVTPFGKTKQISLQADARDVLRSPHGKVNAEIQEFQTTDLVVRSMKLEASGDEKGVKFEGKAQGHSSRNFDFETRGEWARMKTSDRFQLRTLNGNFGKYPLRLQQPFVLDRSAQDISFEKLALNFGKGSLEASGKYGPGNVNLNARFEQFPLEMLSLFGAPDIQGTGAGSIRLTGDPSRPVARLNLNLTDVRARKPSLQQVPPITFTAEGFLEGGKFRATAELAGPVKKPATAALTVPVRFSLHPFAFDLLPGSSIEGSLEAEADLARVIQFVPQEGNKASGHFKTHLQIEGTVSQPRISGDAVIENGHYENQVTGTVLDKISLKISGNGSRLEVENLNATDGAQGSIGAGGGVDLDSERHFPFQVDLTFKDAALVRREDVSGTISGELNLKGSSQDVGLEGKLTITPAQVNLPRTLPPEMTKLEVIEINGPAKSAVVQKPVAPSVPFKTALDLRVELPDRIFVRGRGLESEWGGSSLSIKGSADAPVITGDLDVIRGYFDFLDRRFKLVSGTIQFDGAYPPSPYLEVTAEAQAKDITARLLVSGLASSPKIELQSDPYLPQDEILARILFNRSVNNITPVQALKLARAAEALASGGDTLDFMGKSRQVLGLDQLDIREAESSGPAALGIGKYLTEDIYVDIQKDVSGEAGKATVEVEVTPNITITGEAGADATTGLGLNWKYDY